MPARQHWPGPAVGKPTKGKKSTISVRVTDRLKAKLNDESLRNDRPLSQEAELQLEIYQKRREALLRMLDLMCGHEAVGLILLIGELAVDVLGQWPSGELVRSLSDPWAFDELRKAIMIELERIKPPGDITPPAAGSTAAAKWPEFEQELIKNHGLNAANAVHRTIFETRRRGDREDAIRAGLPWVGGAPS